MEIEKNEKLTVSITSGTFVKGILIILLFWFLFYIKDLVLVVLVSIVIASGIEPLILWLRKFKLSRLPSAIISYLVIFALFGTLLFNFVPSILQEASDFLGQLPAYLDSTTLWNPVSSSDVTSSQKVVENLQEGINNPGQVLKDTASQIKPQPNTSFGIGDLVRGVQNLLSNTSDGFIKILSTIFGGVLSFILIVILSFYLTVQEDGVAKFLQLITPIKHEKYIVGLWKRSEAKIARWVQGQLLLGILVGVLVYLGLVILGIKNALLISVVTGILELIPVFGPIMASIPAILTGFIEGGITMALLVAGLYIVVQQFESNLIYPLVVKKITGVSPILVILSIIIGLKLAGFLGVILSVPFVSALMEFVEDIQKRKIVFWQKAETEKTNE
jgi:predicted PurR-regulated permease PerM